VALRLLVDRRDELSARRVQTVNRLNRLLTANKAKRLLATVRPRSLGDGSRQALTSPCACAPLTLPGQ